MMSHISKSSGEEDLEELWKAVLGKQQQLANVDDDTTRSNNESAAKHRPEQERKWPGYDAVMSEILNSDYNQILTCPMDMVDRGDANKTICPRGVIAKARLELFHAPPAESNNDNHRTHYTGILTPGLKWDHCLLRLSSALQPPGDAIKSTWARTLLYTTGEKIRKARLYPCTALKVFVNNNNDKETKTGRCRSRNVLFAGSKVGQRETDFFAHCQCTSMTERMPSAVKPFCKKFWNYSKWPLSLGISDFCKPVGAQTKDDDEHDDHDDSLLSTTTTNFPFALIIKPIISQSEHSRTKINLKDDKDDSDRSSGDNGKGSDNKATGDSESGNSLGSTSGWNKLSSFGYSKRGSSFTSNNSNNCSASSSSGNFTATSFDSFMNFSLREIPQGTHLFDLYACPTPYDVKDPSKLQRIGKIVTTSLFVESTPDDGLFFKHQAKEEDYALRPDWPDALNQVVSIDQGKVTGTVGTLAGWKLFEQQINQRQYIDFETMK